MRYVLSAVVLLTMLTGFNAAHAEEGAVTEVTPDTITILQGGIKSLTFSVSNELLTNTYAGRAFMSHSAPFINVKKGDKVRLEVWRVGGQMVCISIAFEPPGDAGIVTELGKEAVTIRNDKGKTTKYKISKALKEANPNVYFSSNYSSRLGQVKKGCLVEIQCYKDKETGDLVVSGFDVKIEQEKEK